MRKRVRLTEGDLHRIIKKSVNRIIRENKLNTRSRNRVIRESGDLYGHYDDGTPFTNSKKDFMEYLELFLSTTENGLT